jgi:hypothetical protein
MKVYWTLHIANSAVGSGLGTYDQFVSWLEAKHLPRTLVGDWEAALLANKNPYGATSYIDDNHGIDTWTLTWTEIFTGEESA